jgi:hypothetical protein
MPTRKCTLEEVLTDKGMFTLAVMSDFTKSITPKVLGVFFIKTASKQPLFKAR